MATISDTEINNEQLGLNILTTDDMHEMVTYESNGDIHIKAICEDCHEAFMKNPDLHQYDYLIH